MGIVIFTKEETPFLFEVKKNSIEHCAAEATSAAHAASQFAHNARSAASAREAAGAIQAIGNLVGFLEKAHETASDADKEHVEFLAANLGEAARILMLAAFYAASKPE